MGYHGNSKILLPWGVQLHRVFYSVVTDGSSRGRGLLGQSGGALEKAGINQSKYCGHSFCIGAATSAASRGAEDAIIKTLEYVKIPRDQLASFATRLLSMYSYVILNIDS